MHISSFRIILPFWSVLCVFSVKGYWNAGTMQSPSFAFSDSLETLVVFSAFCNYSPSYLLRSHNSHMTRFQISSRCIASRLDTCLQFQLACLVTLLPPPPVLSAPLPRAPESAPGAASDLSRARCRRASPPGAPALTSGAPARRCPSEDEEDELSEVQQDAVPPEVREWLASTFTRQNTLHKKRADGQPKFRTVANVIRMGIMVEKMTRRMSSSGLMEVPPAVTAALQVGHRPGHRPGHRRGAARTVRREH